MSEEEAVLRELANEVLRSRIDRRAFLQRAAALGVSASVAGAFLATGSSSAAPKIRKMRTATGNAPAPGKRGGTLVFGPFADGADYDPATNDFDFPNPPFPSIYEGLTAYNPLLPSDSAPLNLLAEAVEKNADGTQYHFKLREGVEFHQGFGEMTATDVKYSFERNAGLLPLYPGAPSKDTSYYAGTFSGLETVKVTGTYTGTVIFKDPFVPFETLTLPWTTAGYIFPQKAVAKYGSGFNQHPVGTGPYEVVSYTPSSEMILQKFDHYSGANLALGAKNWYDEIRVNMTALDAAPKGEAATVALESGESDFTYDLGALDIDRLKSNPAYRTYSPPAPLDYYFLGMDVQNPDLKDIRVREAIRSALTIPEIITANRLPLSTRLPSLIAKQMSVGYWSGAPVFKQDIKKAKSLLSAAGVKDLTLTLANPLIDESPGEPDQLMTVIQSNLAEVGITVNIVLTPPDSYVTKAGEGQLLTSYYGGAPDPYYQFEWFTCDQIGVWNYASWCNKTYSSDFTKLGETSVKSERDAISIAMQKLFVQTASYVWLSSAVNFAASNSETYIVWDRNGNPLLHYAYRVS